MSLIVDGLLKTIATFHPEYKTMIDYVIAHEDEIEKLAPIVDAAAKEGPGAFAAAEEHAPELAKAIRSFVDTLPGKAATADEATATLAKHREIVTRHITGTAAVQDSPTSSGMDNAGGNLGDSRVGSG